MNCYAKCLTINGKDQNGGAVHPILEHHSGEYGKNPFSVVSAPGRVSLLGEFSSPGDGLLLQLAIDKRLYVACSPRSDNSLRFYSVDLGERKKSSLSGLKYKREDRWANYIKGVIFAFLNSGHPIKGMDITIQGDIPQGVGLGSSAALCIAAASAICQVFSLELSTFQILDAARQSEVLFLGQYTGMGQAMAALKSEKGKLLFTDLKNLENTSIDYPRGDAFFVLTDSKVPQNSFESDGIDYQQEIKDLVTYLGKRKSGSSLRDFSKDDLREVVGKISEEVRRRCIHLLEESERVEDGINYLEKGDFESFGRLMNRSHEGLRDMWEVSCPEIDWLVKRAWETPGVYGSKMTGEGFGGCTVSLMTKLALEEYTKHLEEYDRIFGFTPEYMILEPSDGLRFENTL